MIERLQRVVVEADDEAGEDVQSVGVNLAHRGEDVLARVLKLLRFFETLFIRRFNPDEHPREVRFRKEREQLLVLREIQRCLGAELEVVIVLALINAQVTEQLLGDVFVTDEVVVDEKYVSRAESAESIELASDLLARFRARLAPEHHDDVAELTAKWTAARELQADVRVAVELQQIESRRRRIGERGSSDDRSNLRTLYGRVREE